MPGIPDFIHQAINIESSVVKIIQICQNIFQQTEIPIFIYMILWQDLILPTLNFIFLISVMIWGEIDWDCALTNDKFKGKENFCSGQTFPHSIFLKEEVRFSMFCCFYTGHLLCPLTDLGFYVTGTFYHFLARPFSCCVSSHLSWGWTYFRKYHILIITFVSQVLLPPFREKTISCSVSSYMFFLRTLNILLFWAYPAHIYVPYQPWQQKLVSDARKS